jgi:hypothetical protein
MALRIITWIVFIACLGFAFFAITLPGQYYLGNPAEIHRVDYVIGWFWMTVFGFFPAVLLLGLVFLQRKAAPRWCLVLWTFPALPVLVSAGVLFLQSRSS